MEKLSVNTCSWESWNRPRRVTVLLMKMAPSTCIPMHDQAVTEVVVAELPLDGLVGDGKPLRVSFSALRRGNAPFG